jgi:Glycosyl transferase family 2
MTPKPIFKETLVQIQYNSSLYMLWSSCNHIYLRTTFTQDKENRRHQNTDQPTALNSQNSPKTDIFRTKKSPLLKPKTKAKQFTIIAENKIMLNTNHEYGATQAIVAALNEEEGIGLTLLELSENFPFKKITVVDGHSHDRTVEVAKDCGADILFQDGNGKGDAIAKAIENMETTTKYIVLTDADYTYPAEYLPDMIEILDENPNVGMVCGNRFTEQTENKAFKGSFYMGNKMLAIAHNMLNGVALKDPLTGLRVIRADTLKNWKIKSKGFDIEVELNNLIERKRQLTVEVPIKYRKRLGEKKLKVRHGATILKRIILETIR